MASASSFWGARFAPWRDRLDIGCVRRVRIGHDRGRVRIDEDDAIALLAQRLARLHPGIVELASLPDNNGPRADDQDRVDIGAFGRTPRGPC